MTDSVAAGDAKLIVGSFYWVRRYGENGLTIGQLCSAGGSRRHWLIVGDEQDIYWTEITVISGPLQEPAPVDATILWHESAVALAPTDRLVVGRRYRTTDGLIVHIDHGSCPEEDTYYAAYDPPSYPHGHWAGGMDNIVLVDSRGRAKYDGRQVVERRLAEGECHE